MILGIVISIYAGLGIGQLLMGFSLLTIPIAIKMEQSILEEKGVDYKNGSPLGNFLAKFLGAIFICGALWVFGTLFMNVIRLNG